MGPDEVAKWLNFSKDPVVLVMEESVALTNEAVLIGLRAKCAESVVFREVFEFEGINLLLPLIPRTIARELHPCQLFRVRTALGLRRTRVPDACGVAVGPFHVPVGLGFACNVVFLSFTVRKMGEPGFCFSEAVLAGFGSHCAPFTITFQLD